MKICAFKIHPKIVWFRINSNTSISDFKYRTIIGIDIDFNFNPRRLNDSNWSAISKSAIFEHFNPIFELINWFDKTELKNTMHIISVNNKQLHWRFCPSYIFGACIWFWSIFNFFFLWLMKSDISNIERLNKNLSFFFFFSFLFF